MVKYGEHFTKNRFCESGDKRYYILEEKALW